jgi:hypothetical protein
VRKSLNSNRSLASLSSCESVVLLAACCSGCRWFFRSFGQKGAFACRESFVTLKFVRSFSAKLRAARRGSQKN